MKRPLHNPIILTIALLLIIPCVSIAGQFKVVRVFDGNTVKAIGHDIEIKVRLVGIDAPETKKGKRKPGQPYSQKATKFLAKLVLNKTIEVKGYGVDRYNRILGLIFAQNTNVNLELVRAGLAEFYRGRSPKFFDIAPYRKAESEAKDAGIGM